MSRKRSYSRLDETYKENTNEGYFVSYAVRGPTISSSGMEAGLPVNHPINAPTTQPSPLNTGCMYAAPGFHPTCKFSDL